MTTKEKAEKKIEIAIDKLIDLMDYCGPSIRYRIDEALEKVREIESMICNSEVKNKELHY